MPKQRSPSPAAGAAVIDLPSGDSHTVTIDLGVQTNNVAEYSGAIAALASFTSVGFFKRKLLITQFLLAMP